MMPCDAGPMEKLTLALTVGFIDVIGTFLANRTVPLVSSDGSGEHIA
jgi:hypothetical protein